MMREIITKKPMKLGTVNIPIGTEIDNLPDGVIKELTTRGLADLVKVPEKKHKEKKSEMGP
jgi:hypothetical protein